MTAPRRVLLVEKSFGLSGSTISLATLLKHLDRDAYIAGAAVSRAEQRDFLRERVDRLATIEIVSERPSFASGPRWARQLAFTQRRVPFLRRPLLWFIALLDVGFSTMPYALRLARIGRHWRADLVHQN